MMLPPLGPGGWSPYDAYANNIRAVPSAYGPQAPWWPQQNLEHRRTVQLQANPYYPHWPRAQGGFTLSAPDKPAVQASFGGIGLVSALGFLLGAAATRTVGGAVASGVSFGLIGVAAVMTTVFDAKAADPLAGR